MNTGVDLFEKDDYENAYPLLELQAAAENPPATASLYLGILQARHRYDYNHLAQIADQCLPNTNTALAHYAVGTAFHQDFYDHDLAIKHLKISLQLNDSHPKTKYVLALAHLARSEDLEIVNILAANQDRQQAAHIANPLVDQFPNNLHFLSILADALAREDCERALALYDRALALIDESSCWYSIIQNGRAGALAGLGRSKESTQTLLDLVEINEREKPPQLLKYVEMF